MGYITTPIYYMRKNPILNDWTNERNYNLPPERYKNKGIGIICGASKYPMYALDIDITHQEIVDYLIKFIEKKLLLSALQKSSFMYRVGLFPKTLILFKGEKAGIRKQSSSWYMINNKQEKIECLGFGQQFVAFGIHPDTKKSYKWFNGSPLKTYADELPVMTQELLDIIFREFYGLMSIYGFNKVEKERKENTVQQISQYDPNDPLDIKEPLGLSPKELYNLFCNVNPDCSRYQWIRIGMAVHHETKGSKLGFNLWNQWSSTGKKYNANEMESQWKCFNRDYNKEPVTAAYLFTLEDKKDDEVISNNFDNLNWSLSRFSNYVPSLPMIIENMLPKGIVNLAYSAGGVGKSTFFLYLAMILAASNIYKSITFLGNILNGGITVILTAEDSDIILNRRFIKILENISNIINIDISKLRGVIESYLFIISTYGISAPLFAVKPSSGLLKPTNYFKNLLGKLKEIDNLSLIVIDTKTRFSPGEGYGNVTATQEISYYEQIARETGASVMLLHHSSKKARGDAVMEGEQAYRDATALYDSVRAAWYLRRLKPKEITNLQIPIEDIYKYMIFQNTKNNYIEQCPDLLIKREGYSYSHEIVELIVPKEKVATLKKQQLMDRLIIYMQKSKINNFSQGDLIKLGEEYEAGRSRVLQSLRMAEDQGLVISSDTVQGRVKEYQLTNIGKRYNMDF